MLPTRRTLFNILFQPARIGKTRKRPFRRLKWLNPTTRTRLQKHRRAHQGWRNNIFGRHTALKTLISYYIKFPDRTRSGVSIFRKR